MSDPTFIEAVRAEFRFLEDRGFVRAREESNFVAYESGPIYVYVYLEHGHDLGATIGRRIGSKRGYEHFSIEEIIDLLGKREEANLRPLQISGNPEKISPFVTEVARWVRTYGGSALAGDDQLFAELGREESLQALLYAAARLRPQADVAWQAKDYGRVVALYEEIAAYEGVELTSSEAAKLRYSRARS